MARFKGIRLTLFILYYKLIILIYNTAYNKSIKLILIYINFKFILKTY
ncbi:uncharacterized protein FPRO_03843 [Fusarium proliferatum ET1]|uniref:Uncharacterized protein n=1 Tax=Fusarium proliferatum (strain ET1) TaxID=1227346 RepID=A0A1L7V4V2_FUSPR|nr:uncharacterized protein FPRO_03843 [Fusarium proliferatum ET1]CZR35897.1 uncharacterized protein FPRO_03843 [Fusarium proliferatum ET1]